MRLFSKENTYSKNTQMDYKNTARAWKSPSGKEVNG